MDTTKHQARIINGLLIFALASTMFPDRAKAAHSTSLSGSQSSVTAERTVKLKPVKPVAPSITIEPASQTVSAGQSATFTVADTGTAPMSYQWRKNGAAIRGATSDSYTTPAASSSSSGSLFTVKVSNSRGSVTSGAAALTVNVTSPTPTPAPAGILSPSATSLNFGSEPVSTDSMQTVTLTNAGSANVTISSVSVSGPGFNAGGIPSGTILAPGQSATVNASFEPAGSGSVTGSISVASDATGGATVISLAGQGTAPVLHSATLSWTPSSSSVVSYNVYVSMVSGSSYTVVANATTPSYTDGNLQASQTRYYVITAVDSNNRESAYSNQVAAIIP